MYECWFLYLAGGAGHSRVNLQQAGHIFGIWRSAARDWIALKRWMGNSPSWETLNNSLDKVYLKLSLDWQLEERVRSLLLLPRVICHRCWRSCVMSGCCIQNCFSFLRFSELKSSLQFLEKQLLGDIFCYEGQRLTPFPASIATCLKNLCLEIFLSSLDALEYFPGMFCSFPFTTTKYGFCLNCRPQSIFTFIFRTFKFFYPC